MVAAGVCAVAVAAYSMQNPFHVAIVIMCYCRSLRIVQAKANKLAKRLEEEHGSLESCTEALSHQHAEQVHVLEHQIAEAQHMQVHAQSTAS